MDHGDHDPPWWTRSVQDHLGSRSDISLMGPGVAQHLFELGVREGVVNPGVYAFV